MNTESKVPFIEGVLDAPELNVDQVYDKFCQLKESVGYKFLNELNTDETLRDMKLAQLVQVANRFNIAHTKIFEEEELDIENLKENGKISQSFYSKLLRIARTDLISVYKRDYHADPWAVKLLLCQGPISCWLAIDTSIVVDYIEADFETEISGYQYLEKVINLPFTIPLMNEKNKVPFIEGVLDAPELNADQVYNKLCHLKESVEYEFLSEVETGAPDTDAKLTQLVKVARRFNDKQAKIFKEEELNIEILKKDSKISHSFYSKLLRIARTDLISVYKNIYNLLKEEEEGGESKKIYGILEKSDGEKIELQGNEGILFCDAKRMIKLPSPKIDENFKALKSKEIQSATYATFLKRLIRKF
eukprot:CAMPEP_0183745212 /NCGR_PEP_ID=MMETSP0737-20130205/66125_1 /TAXON_ID=385413 /ORGANISM="Thalassiosira miniscula, Strain CCMP1093" /LENGTH=360 /DNA_ID=CAMNT_0025980871 /DNA_START=113 /DNA_END=1196 /DNA_ORIENTATION=-